MPIEHQERKNHIFDVMGDTVTGRIDTDQTGAFPIVFSQRNLYIFIRLQQKVHPR